MNEKASVSKRLNAKHAKILLDLLKQPGNKECADCRNKGPRWASINLGIFICMQCSGIHRSLGVHISKVRSTTLDTWLPDQVAFMQAMGNEKANSYWEMDLPAVFYRSPIETFIKAKYVSRRWAPTTPQPIPEIYEENNSLTTLTRKEIPKRARRYSLDEEFFIKGIPNIEAQTSSHCRAESFDFGESFEESPSPVSFEACPSIKNVDAGTDLFSLLYVSEETQDRTVVPPSRWATFECKKNSQMLY
ncbi:hypothetical protein SASPL_136509 [Salvia splendens]|uniref:Arf-GAP domain-containing protein n=2 Tax=Salvia splendens TaxID=180675 RepID=A0A8X8ZGY3_SALSN|nr:hypothetical protein SASPL_136509 [Salvia splendens]